MVRDSVFLVVLVVVVVVVLIGRAGRDPSHVRSTENTSRFMPRRAGHDPSHVRSDETTSRFSQADRHTGRQADRHSAKFKLLAIPGCYLDRFRIISSGSANFIFFHLFFNS